MMIVPALATVYFHVVSPGTVSNDGLSTGGPVPTAA